MPRSRRRHHSRSKSRSRSHSHDRDRDVKRRKIDNYESPHNRRSVSCGDDTVENEEIANVMRSVDLVSDDVEVDLTSTVENKSKDNNTVASKNLKVTPKKVMSPKQLQKKAESEKKKLQKQQERDERERKRQEEKMRLKDERDKQKQEKEVQKMKDKLKRQEQKQQEIEQKQREKEEREEQKRKEKEEKEQKRREKEEREEQRRKEKEQERCKRQQEIDEKVKEKQRLEEQKQKAAAVFANFFVCKKTGIAEEKLAIPTSNFMPFEVKTDMRLAPICRKLLTSNEKDALTKYLNKQEGPSYLVELKSGKVIGRSFNTWPFEDLADEVTIVENDLGETIDEQKPKLEKMRIKFLKFHDNQRPPYYGTWRKKSKTIRARNPIARDKVLLDYDVDSDDDWEEEEQGESLNGSDDEDKENESENEYEEDNVFFVPHGHLSEDEVDDEETARVDPECQKAKLKLLKNEFDEEMKWKMNKIQPRSIGCIWYNKELNNVDEAIDVFLKPLAILTDGPVIIKKRSEINVQWSLLSSQKKNSERALQRDHIPHFLRLIHGNTNNQKTVVDEFLTYMSNNGIDGLLSKRALLKQMKQLAQWIKCPDDGVMHNKFCWYVGEDVRKEYNTNITLPNDH